MRKVTKACGVCVVLFMITSFAVSEKEKLQWLSLTEAEAMLRKEKRPVLIDLYTDWCSWCKVMDKKTYTHEGLVKYVQEKFYPVKVDAESREKLKWMGREYAYNNNYRVNTYALYLTNGQLQFPTTVILPADGSAPQAIPGYLKPGEMEIILKYFGEGKYGVTPFNEFNKNFKPAWK
jgi:thioredoxin-related protein